MRNILALIGALVVGFAVLGWYSGWYTFTTEAGADGHRKINVDVNTKEFVDDVTNGVKSGANKVGNIINNENKGTTTPTTPQKEVQGQPTGFQFDNDGSVKIVLPKIEFKGGK